MLKQTTRPHLLGNKYRVGKIPWNKGLKTGALSIEHRRKLSLSHMGNQSAAGSVRTEEFKEHAKKIQRGSKSHHWQGERVKYRPLHAWVQREKGKPEACEHCHKSGLTGRKIHWANKSGYYKRNVDDWIRLCPSCHYKYDH